MKCNPLISISPHKRDCSLLLMLLLFVIMSVTSLHANAISVNGTCHDRCGTIPIKFPFGSGSGCGHPDFSRFITCSADGTTLQFSTPTGAAYAVSSIDYAASTLVVADPLMSTCASMQNSGSFALDRTGPFTVAPDNIFALVGCSTTSPVFDPDADFCDTGSGQNVCRGLYSCRGVEGIGLEPHAPVSTCCVYEAPVLGVGSGSGLVLDLPKLQCSSYSAVYGFGGSEGGPMQWEYGILMEYDDSAYNYSSACRNCEESGGVCGFEGLGESFACRCQNGVNTTVNCYGRGYAWSGTTMMRVRIDQREFTIGGLILLIWIVDFFF